MSLAQRMGSVREAMGLSQRAMSLKLGLSPNAWAVYESGKSTPGANVLESVARLGIGLDWLVLGEGVMWRSKDEPPNNGLPAVVEQRGAAAISNLELGRLIMLAHRGKWRLNMSLLSALFAALPAPSSLEDLCAAVTEFSHDDVLAELLALVNEGCVVETMADGVVKYEPASQVVDTTATHRGDAEQVLMTCVELLLREIGPKAKANDGSGVLVHVNAFVEHGKQSAFVQELCDFLRASVAQNVATSKSEQVQLVFGACAASTTNPGGAS